MEATCSSETLLYSQNTTRRSKPKDYHLQIEEVWEHKKNEVTGGWRKLHNEEVHVL
jgi:hypothetical protein